MVEAAAFYHIDPEVLWKKPIAWQTFAMEAKAADAEAEAERMRHMQQKRQALGAAGVDPADFHRFGV